MYSLVIALNLTSELISNRIQNIHSEIFCAKPDEQKLSDGKAIHFEGMYRDTYHYKFLSSEKCPAAWIAVSLSKEASGAALDAFKAAHEGVEGVIGGDYYIVCDGTFHVLTQSEKKLLHGYEAAIVLTKIDVLVREKAADLNK